MAMNTFTYEQREATRQRIIREQLDKMEAGLEQILDGTYAAEVHLFNARHIAKGEQLAKIEDMLAKVKAMRLEMWSVLGMSNSNTFQEV